MDHVQDPVCGMEIDPTQAAGQASYQGRTFYFCSEECMQKFQQNPGEYVGTNTGGDDPATTDPS
jgi:Cu+-exporting ATPase